MQEFKDFGFSDSLLEALDKKGFVKPTPIQAQTIPLLMNGTINLIGQAQTGTGKTAAFGLPILERLERDNKTKAVQAIILAPTRELALQVSRELDELSGRKRLVITAVYGGQSIEQQIRRLKSGVDIVVGTPGRVLDHLNRGTLDLSKVQYFVLDEADEMLNMGFIEDVETILKAAPKERHMLLFSATMPSPIRKIAKQYMGDYDQIAVQKEDLTTDLTDQMYFFLYPRDRVEVLGRIIDISPDFYGLVFCNTRIDADDIAAKLIERGYNADALHGDISQYQREKILNKFRHQHLRVLVATDVAARGIDINNLTHVINYDLPQDPEAYVHRIGRTGRAGKKGIAISMVGPSEYSQLLYIQRLANTQIRREKVPPIEVVTSQRQQQLFNDLDIESNKSQESVFNEFAARLLEDKDPLQVVAGILAQTCQEQLNPKHYREIREPNLSTGGNLRLFFGKGRNDGIHARKLIEIIQGAHDIPSTKIHDIRVLEGFSFFTVPFRDGELLLEIFKRQRQGNQRPLVVRAKSRT